MFLETEENAELLELLSQVRATAALEESEGALPLTGDTSDLLHHSLQHRSVSGVTDSLGMNTAIFHRESPSTTASAEVTHPLCDADRSSAQPFTEPLGSIRDLERGSWSSLEPNPSSRSRSKQLHSGLMSDVYGLSPTSTLPTPAMGCGGAPSVGVVAARGHHAHLDAAGRLISSEHGGGLQRTTVLDSLHPTDEHEASQRKLSFTEGTAGAASAFAYTNSSTRMTVSPTDATTCDALRQPLRPAEMRYTLCQTRVVNTPDLPSSAVAPLGLLPSAIGGKGISTASNICEAMATQQLIGACATPPTTSSMLALGPAYGGLLHGWERVQTGPAGTTLPFASDGGSPHSVTPLHRKALPCATSSGERHLQVPFQHSSGEGMLNSHGNISTAHAVNIEVGTGSGHVIGQNSDPTGVVATRNNDTHHAMPMNISLPATPVHGGGWGNEGCTATDIWQQVPQTINDEDCGTPQHHLLRPRSNELNIFMLPSPPRPLAALPLKPCATETAQQMQHVPFSSDSSGRSPIDPTHIHHYLSSLHIANMRGGTETFPRPTQPNQEGSHPNIRTGYSNPTMTQVPPVITMHAVRPKASTSSDPPSQASRPITKPSNIPNAHTSNSVVVGSTAVQNSTSVFLSSIAHLQDGHTPCGSKPSGMDWQRGFNGQVGPAQTSRSEDNSANTPGSGGPPPSERYAHYLQRGVLTSPFMPIQQANAHPQLQRRPNSTTAVTLNATATPKTTKNSNPRNLSSKGACSTTNTSMHVGSGTAAVGAGRVSSGTRQSNNHHSHSAAAGSPNAPGCVSPSIAATLLLFLNTPECGDSNGDNTLAEDDVAGGVLGRQILALSRDQQGCRSLQAVLDCEAANRYGDAMMPSARARSSQDYGGAQYQKDDSDRLGGDTVVDAVNAVASENVYSLPPLSLPLRRIIAALEPHLPQVMSDAYGNFLVQKLFEVLNDDERLPLLCKGSILHKGLGEVACSPHGTFAVQRLVETLRNEAEEQAVFSSLGDHLVQLLLDANGGHVLLKVMSYIKGTYGSRGAGVGSASVSPTAVNPHATLEESNVESNPKYHGSKNAVSEENSYLRKAMRSGELSIDAMRQKTRFLYDGLLKSLLVVCRHRQGCCITQKCLDFFAQMFPVTSEARDALFNISQPSGNEDFFVGLVKKLLEHLAILVMDPYGNYVITHAVEVCYARGSIQLVDVVAQRMQERMTLFCKDKYASNVMEHVLRYSSEKRIRAFCRNLLTPSTLALSASRERSIGRGNSDKKTTKIRDAHGCESEGNAVPGDSAVLSDCHLWPLVDVALDPFGNYVVQTLLTVAPVDELFHVEDTTQSGLSESLELNNEKSHTHDENHYLSSRQGNHPSTLANKMRDNAYGLLPILQRYLPLLQEKSFTRKIETKMELALLRVEEEKMRRQHQK